MVKRKHEPMVSPKGRPHPSGAPDRRGKYVDWPIERTRDRDPLTPGLRRDGRTYAVGFTADIGGEWDEDTD